MCCLAYYACQSHLLVRCYEISYLVKSCVSCCHIFKVRLKQTSQFWHVEFGFRVNCVEKTSTKNNGFRLCSLFHLVWVWVFFTLIMRRGWNKMRGGEGMKLIDITIVRSYWFPLSIFNWFQHHNKKIKMCPIYCSFSHDQITITNISHLFTACSVAVSAWTLVAIALERYYAICDPLRSRQWQTLDHAYKLIVLIWCSSLICMSPIAVFSQIIPTFQGNINKSRIFVSFSAFLNFCWS